MKMLTWCQNKMIHLDATKMVIKLMSHKDVPCQKACLRFGIAMLEEGNKLGQVRLLEGLRCSAGNISQADFFNAINSMLKSSQVAIEEHLTLQDQEDSFMRRSSRDGSSRTVRQSAHAAEKLSGALQLDSATLALRFLQLMCEGHNSDAQNYLRTQTSVLHATVKVVEFLVSVLHRYVSDGSVRETSVTELLVQALDFLSEAMLGPCAGNQAWMMESDLASLLRTLFAMLSYDKSEHQGISLEDLMPINQVKAAVVNVLIAMLEGNTTHRLVGNVILNFPIHTLLDNICIILDPNNGVLARALDFKGSTEVDVEALQKWRSKQASAYAQQVTDARNSTEKEPGHEGIDELHEEALRCYMVAVYFSQYDKRLGFKSTRQMEDHLVHALGSIDKNGVPRCAIGSLLLEAWINRCEIMRDGEVHQLLALPPYFMVQRRQNPHSRRHYKKEFELISRDDPSQKAEEMAGVLKALVYENEHHLLINTNPAVEWMSRPLLATAIADLPFALSVVISLALTLLYGYKGDPFGNYSGAYEVVVCCTFVHICFTLLEVASFFVREAPLLNKLDKNPFEEGCAAPDLPEADLLAGMQVIY